MSACWTSRSRLRLPRATRSPKHSAQIRHLKARMERERIPRGTDPRRHLKLGPGGLSDVEFAVQILQLATRTRHRGAARDEHDRRA